MELYESIIYPHERRQPIGMQFCNFSGFESRIAHGIEIYQSRLLCSGSHQNHLFFRNINTPTDDKQKESPIVIKKA